MPRAPVIDHGDEPVPPEILADAILRVSEGMTALRASGVNRKAIVILLADATGIGKRSIESILDALADMKRAYCT